MSVVWKLDRLDLDRNLRHLVDTAQDLSARGVGLGVLVGDGAQADTATTAGRLVFGIFAAPAGLERELIRERTVAGPRQHGAARGGGQADAGLGRDAVHRVTRSSMNTLASRRLANAAEGFHSSGWSVAS